METYFFELIRGIDSSLLEEWERMKNPDYVAEDVAEKPARPESFDIIRDKVAFTRLVRTAFLGFLQDIAARDWEAAVERLSPEPVEDPLALLPEVRRVEQQFASYFDARGRFRLDPEGRSAQHTHVIEETDTHWLISHVLVDSEALNDWEAQFSVSLVASRAAGHAVVSFVKVAPIADFSDADDTEASPADQTV